VYIILLIYIKPKTFTFNGRYEERKTGSRRPVYLIWQLGKVIYTLLFQQRRNDESSLRSPLFLYSERFANIPTCSSLFIPVCCMLHIHKKFIPRECELNARAKYVVQEQKTQRQEKSATAGRIISQSPRKEVASISTAVSLTRSAILVMKHRKFVG
jgi:hypothetical protein